MRKSRSWHPYVRWEGIVQHDGHILQGITAAVSEAKAGSNLRNQFFEQYRYRPPKDSSTVWEKGKKPALATAR